MFLISCFLYVIELFTVLFVSMPACLHISVDNEIACRPLLTGIAVQWSWDKSEVLTKYSVEK